MTFPLGSLRGDVAALPLQDGPSAPAWRRHLVLATGGVAWLLFVLALATHSALDAAFSTSGGGGAVVNKAGRLGAWVSDLAYFLLGFSAWWLVPVALRAWLSALAQTVRGAEAPETPPAPPRWLFWLGLAMLLAASTALEWTRLYRVEPLLPGHAGGVSGYLLGLLSMGWLGCGFVPTSGPLTAQLPGVPLSLPTSIL